MERGANNGNGGCDGNGRRRDWPLDRLGLPAARRAGAGHRSAWRGQRCLWRDCGGAGPACARTVERQKRISTRQPVDGPRILGGCRASLRPRYRLCAHRPLAAAGRCRRCDPCSNARGRRGRAVAGRGGLAHRSNQRGDMGTCKPHRAARARYADSPDPPTPSHSCAGRRHYCARG